MTFHVLIAITTGDENRERPNNELADGIQEKVKR